MLRDNVPPQSPPPPTTSTSISIPLPHTNKSNSNRSDDEKITAVSDDLTEPSRTKNLVL